jgi:hypothetical protein
MPYWSQLAQGVSSYFSVDYIALADKRSNQFSIG